jgi:4-carboxymuconolactone decarboxylase
MSTAREEGLELLREMVPEMIDPATGDLRNTEGFATGLAEQTLDAVFSRLWTRPGLDRRSRSLVTLGILIALRADNELKYHFPIAVRNGLTRDELEEVVYHSAAYAGFPAASAAGRVGREVLGDAEPDPRAG